MGWIEQVKNMPLPQVARAVGLTVRGRSQMGPCPACQADKRGGEDSRLPMSYGNDGGWKCHRCATVGDAVDLLACTVAGRRFNECSPSEKHDTKLRAEELGFADDDGSGRRHDDMARPSSARPAPARVARRMGDDNPARPGGPEDPDLQPTHMESDTDGALGKRPMGGRSWEWDPALADAAQVTLWDDPEAEPVRRYLLSGPGSLPGGADGRRLPEDAVRKWKLGAYRDSGGGWWVTIPLLDSSTGEPVNIRYRRIPDPDGSTPSPKYRVCAGRELPLFGVRAMSDDLAAPVLICEGELDVVALWAYGYERGVVSGTGGAGTWKDEWLDVLEPYRSFVLVYDDDKAGEEGAEMVAEKLGKYRVSRAELPHKDAGECWLHAVDVAAIDHAVDHARGLIEVELLSPSYWRTAIERGVNNPQELVGLPTGSPRLDKMFGGIPVGLTVVTGDSGAGKTSFCSWLLYEQARRGVAVGFTSFEQHMKGTVQKLLRMQIGGDFLQATQAQRDAAYRNLDGLPIRIVNKYGRIEIPKLLETIRYGRRRLGTRVWLIDHLGFLIDSSKDDERRQIDHLVRTLAILANDEELAVVMIAHPHASRERGHRVTIKDLKGSSAILQDAALGLTVVANDPAKFGGHPCATIHNDKQRTEWGEGTGASCVLYMDPQAILYSDDERLLPCARP